MIGAVGGLLVLAVGEYFQHIARRTPRSSLLTTSRGCTPGPARACAARELAWGSYDAAPPSDTLARAASRRGWTSLGQLATVAEAYPQTPAASRRG